MQRLTLSRVPDTTAGPHRSRIIDYRLVILSWLYRASIDAECAVFWVFVAFLYFRKDEIVERAP